MHIDLIIMLVAWAFVIVWISGVIMANKNSHPKALFILFFTEVWERFSYYGMRALLILYLIDKVTGLKYADAVGYGIYGAYVSLVYATPVIGGVIADRILGSRNAILLGGVLMACGHFAMAFPQEEIFFLALGFLIVGNGFFKPNISTLVGKLYPEGDPRKDSAFTLFYMGVNTGAFLAPLTCGAIGQLYGWHYGFTIAGVGMVLGLLMFGFGNITKAYLDKGLPPDRELLERKLLPFLTTRNLIYVVAFLAVPVMAVLVKHNEESKILLWTVGGAVLIYLFYLSFREEKVARERLWVVLILFVFTIMFWTFFELAGSAITLFTERNVDRVVHFISYEYTFKTSFFQSVNPLFIILLAPLFSILWRKIPDFSAPSKFGIALVQLGMGFGLLVWGAKFAGPDGLSPLVFLIAAYFFHTTGELCLSPIGLSLVTKLSPKQIVAFVMGVWLLSTSFAGLLGGEISKLTSLPSEEGQQPPPTESLLVYSHVFEWIAYISIGTGILLFLLVPLIRKWMHGVK